MTAYTGQNLLDALDAHGLPDWQGLPERIGARFLTGDFATGLELLARIGTAAEEANHHPDVTLTFGYVDIRLTSHDTGAVTERDLTLAAQISDLAASAGVLADPAAPVVFELGLDTAHKEAIAPFWAALLTGDASNVSGHEVVDPSGQVPVVWFQECEEHEVPHQRLHVDISVAPEFADQRIQRSTRAASSSTTPRPRGSPSSPTPTAIAPVCAPSPLARKLGLDLFVPFPGADVYQAAEDRYATMQYRRVGRSGLVLPALSLGLWHNFGDDVAFQNQRDIVRRAFDLGITHFDLANNYGPPPGSAETNFGRLLREDLHPYRDELIISTKAGWAMHPGPYGGPGGSRKYLLASLDASLKRLGLDYVDIFYSHRPDAATPLEETIAALDTAVRSGRALYAGISSYSATDTATASALAKDMGTPLLIHQPSYSMVNRWIESDELLDTTEAEGLGVIAFSPLAQGLLTDKYLGGVPEESRAGKATPSFRDGFLNEDNLERIRGLNDIAAARGQSLAQMALSWALRDERVSSLVIGASRVGQLEHNVAALDSAPLTVEELTAIDEFAVDSGVDIWGDARRSTEE